MSGKVKKVEILKKMKPKIELQYSDKTSSFELKLFSTLQNLEFQTSDGHIKNLFALLVLGKSPSQTVCQSDTN